MLALNNNGNRAVVWWGTRQIRTDEGGREVLGLESQVRTLMVIAVTADADLGDAGDVAREHGGSVAGGSTGRRDNTKKLNPS